MNDKKVWNILLIAALLLQVIAEVFAVVAVLRLNMLPGKYVIVLVVGMVLLAGITAATMFLRIKKPVGMVRRIIGCVLALIIVIACGLIVKLTTDVYDTVSTVTDKVTTTTRNVYVIVLADDAAGKLADASGYTFGFIENYDEEHTQKAIEHIEKSLGGKISTVGYAHAMDLVDALYEGKVQALIMNGVSVAILEEEEGYADFSEKIRILESMTYAQLDGTAEPESGDKDDSQSDSSGQQGGAQGNEGRDPTGEGTQGTNPSKPGEDNDPSKPTGAGSDETGSEDDPSSNEKDPAKPGTQGNKPGTQGNKPGTQDPENPDSTEGGSQDATAPGSTAPADVTNTPFVVYISGVDVTGTSMAGGRSDVNILAVVNPVTKQVLLINTPRDYYIANPYGGGAMDKLTHCGLYGAECSMGALGDLYDLTVDYYCQINFTGFEKLIDAVGGIVVYSNQSFTARDTEIKVGNNSLNGAQALDYARQRQGVYGGDNGRGKNQMKVVKAVIQKLTTGTTVISKYSAILGSLGGMFSTSMSMNDTSKLVKMQLDDLATWNIQSYSVTGLSGKETTYSSPAKEVYVMYEDVSATAHAAKLAQQVIKGETLTSADMNLS